MRIIALRSPGLPSTEISESLASIGVIVTVVTSLEEAKNRKLSLAQIIVDGVGETADALQALSQITDQIERVFWIGFEPPSVALPGLCLINPLNAAASLLATVGDRPDAVAETMVPISLAPREAAGGHDEPWDLGVVEPRAPIDRPRPTVEPMTVDFDEFEGEIEDLVIDADFISVHGSFPWRPWAASAMVVMTVGGLVLFWAAHQFPAPPEIALPISPTNLPVYPMSQGEAEVPKQAAEQAKARVDKVPVQAPTVAASQPVPATKKRLGTGVQFDVSGLQRCLGRLGKKGKARLKRIGKLKVTLRLGVMSDGRVAAATTVKVRIGRKKYRSKKFNACVEGEIAGQKLRLSPKREPTFIRRTFTLRP
jgi:hypothetical protein